VGESENSVERARKGRDSQFEQIVGSSPGLEAVLEQVERVGPTDATVLILGETGTGKELIAQAVHNISARCNRRFVKVNCAAIPFDLLEASCLVMRKALSPAPSRKELADSNWPTRAPFSWMRLAIFRLPCSPNCCVYCKSGSSRD